jgi:ABC-2 type transport system permease protein
LSVLHVFTREVKFAAKDRTLWLWLIVVLLLSTLAVGSGFIEVKHQNATIQRLIDADKQDRLTEFEKVKSWGSAAYYGFHLTYAAPSNFAYAAMGLRDTQPWKHRVRMLALEGQIYERDVGNPSVALIGRFDFAFLAAFIMPLILILLLHDLKASEKTAGRFYLSEATVGQPLFFWLLRASLRAGALFLSLVAPLVITGIIAGTAPATLALASLLVFAYIVFWAMLCFLTSAWRTSGSVILMSLFALWIGTAVLLPAGAKLAIDRWVPVPAGADILMLQRETVNAAWDLPKDVTMQTFFTGHPEWISYTARKDSFDWPWYYAFQQVGDEKTEHLTAAYNNGRLLRARLAAWVSFLAPPSLLERSLQWLAETDMNASLRYENKVRAYHSKLRAFYYPYLFGNEPFDKAALKKIPDFQALN